MDNQNNEKFEQTELEYERQKKFLKLEDEEVRNLEFDPDLEIVPNRYDNEKKRVQYKVIDVDRRTIGQKIFEVSTGLAVQINKFLKNGDKVLKFERVGTGVKTRYRISVV